MINMIESFERAVAGYELVVLSAFTFVFILFTLFVITKINARYDRKYSRKYIGKPGQPG